MRSALADEIPADTEAAEAGEASAPAVDNTGG